MIVNERILDNRVGAMRRHQCNTNLVAALAAEVAVAGVQSN